MQQILDFRTQHVPFLTASFGFFQWLCNQRPASRYRRTLFFVKSFLYICTSKSILIFSSKLKINIFFIHFLFKFQNPDGQECSETQKETSPWWKVDLITPQAVRVVRITTRGCCGHQPIQDLEIRVGNSSVDLQRNPLCAWYPGTVDEGITKTFTCARALVGQYVAIQLVGVEGSLSLCEVEVFTNEEFSVEKCTAPNLSPETVVGTFSRTCYEFHVTRGENFEKAQQICQSHGKQILRNFILFLFL